MHNGAWDGAAGESLSWLGFWNDNLSIPISELWHLLENTVFSFRKKKTFFTKSWLTSNIEVLPFE